MALQSLFQIIEAGAEINATDARGKTASNHALARDLSKIVSVIRAHGEL